MDSRGFLRATLRTLNPRRHQQAGQDEQKPKGVSMRSEKVNESGKAGSQDHECLL